MSIAQQTFGRYEGGPEEPQLRVLSYCLLRPYGPIRYFLYVQILNFVTKVLILNHSSH